MNQRRLLICLLLLPLLLISACGGQAQQPNAPQHVAEAEPVAEASRPTRALPTPRPRPSPTLPPTATSTPGPTATRTPLPTIGPSPTGAASGWLVPVPGAGGDLHGEWYNAQQESLMIFLADGSGAMGSTEEDGDIVAMRYITSTGVVTTEIPFLGIGAIPLAFGYSVKGDLLTIQTTQGNQTLQRVAFEPAPVDPAQLLGRWRSEDTPVNDLAGFELLPGGVIGPELGSVESPVEDTPDIQRALSYRLIEKQYLELTLILDDGQFMSGEHAVRVSTIVRVEIRDGELHMIAGPKHHIYVRN